MNKLTKFFKKIRSKTIGEIKKISLKNKNFSIISNNCWGGIVCQEYNIPYNSPTVGLYFFADDYLNFLERMEYYLSKDLHFIKLEKSKHFKELEKSKYDYSNTVIGVIEDIEIIFLHYEIEEEAREKWIRRKERINFDKMIVKFNDQNGFTKFHYERFKKLPFKNKLFFTSNPEFKDDFCVFFKEYKGLDSVKEDVKSYKRYVNIKEIINGL